MKPFIGSEAIANGTLTRGVLRARYTALVPNIYIPKGAEPTLEVRAQAAWLWSRRTGIISGRTAAGMLGRRWEVTDDPIELIAGKSKHPPSVIIRNERISADEVTVKHGLPITTPVRTALDLARHLPRDEAVALLDPLCKWSGVTMADIWQLAARYPGARNIRSAGEAIVEINTGAETPDETRVRLILSDSGFRPTHTQIRVTDGFTEAVVAMGWPALKVGVDCDYAEGQDRYVIEKAEFLRSQDWLHIQVLPQHSPRSIGGRIREAVWSRATRPLSGWR